MPHDTSTYFHRYVPKDRGFTAVKVTRDNMDAIAKKIGGAVVEETNNSKQPRPLVLKLAVPNIGGTQYAYIGDYVCLMDDGAYTVTSETVLESEYERARPQGNFRSATPTYLEN